MGCGVNIEICLFFWGGGGRGVFVGFAETIVGQLLFFFGVLVVQFLSV